MTERIRVAPNDALVVVDVQRDFLPGGALAVPNGQEVIEPLNRYIALFQQHRRPIVLSRDWHPANHCSFQDQGGPWPPHCVANSPGAAFAPTLKVPSDAIIISKATKPDEEAYSAFQGTDLDQRLRNLNVERIWVGGLATDYCVLQTVLDALENGLSVLLLQDAIRAVNVSPEDGQNAVATMTRRGATPITWDDVV